MKSMIEKARELWRSPWAFLGDLIGAASLFGLLWLSLLIGHGLGL